MEKIYMYQNSKCNEIDNITVRRTDGTIAYCGKPDACVVLIQMTGDKENEAFAMRYLNRESYNNANDVLSTINILLDMMKNQANELSDLANDLFKIHASNKIAGLIKELINNMDDESGEDENGKRI